LVHRRGVFRLDADDPDARIELLDVGGDAGDQAAAAHGDEDRIEFAAGLAQDLHADRALAGNHVRIVERMHEHHMSLAHQCQCVLIGGVVNVPVQHHFGTEVHHRLHLDGRRGLRHHDQRRDAALTRRQRHALCMIAGRSADYSALRDRRRQMGNLVVRAAQLEREHRLQVFALEQDLIAQSTRQPRRGIQRRLDGDVVDARLEYALQVIIGHRMRKPGPGAAKLKLLAAAGTAAGRVLSLSRRAPAAGAPAGS